MDRLLSISKSHLRSIGDTRLIESDTYGNYVSRCIANIDLYPSELQSDEYFKIMNKWHPKHWAGSYVFVADPDTNVESRYVSLFVPLLEDNLDWKKHNSNCEFVIKMAELNKKVKMLPVSVTTKEVNKFLIGFQKLLVIGN